MTDHRTLPVTSAPTPPAVVARLAAELTRKRWAGLVAQGGIKAE
jgi:hypothetical protein